MPSYSLLRWVSQSNKAERTRAVGNKSDYIATGKNSYADTHDGIGKLKSPLHSPLRNIGEHLSLTQMKSLLLLALGSGLFTTGPTDGPTTRKPTAQPVKTLAAALGRCSGNASCRACRNCSACGHCAGGGGTCGVCATYSAPVRTYRAPVRTRPASTRSSSSSSTRTVTKSRPKTVLVENMHYLVNASTLNLRAEPNAEAEVLRVLKAGDNVIVLELMDSNWARVSAESGSLGDLEGYVARTYLSSLR